MGKYYTILTTAAKRSSRLFVSAAILAAVAITNLAPASYAFSASIQDGALAARGADQMTNLFGVGGVFTTITNVLLFVIGAISVIMIIIGGLRYIVSGGNATQVTAAKNTILYAVVGIVVAILAYALVNFVITSFTIGGSSAGTNI